MNINDIFMIPVTEEIIEKTLLNTRSKFLYTITNNAYTRTPVELLDNIYMGDLAKNALFDYLSSVLGNDLIDYDEIRADNFESYDPGWDFKIGSKEIKFEIKSSISSSVDIKRITIDTLASILRNRDIKITASHDKGKTFLNPDDLKSDIHMQIYFLNVKTYKNGYDDPYLLYDDISKDLYKIKTIINSDKYNEPYFFGFSTKREIIAYKEENEVLKRKSTWSFEWTDRLYWKSPLSKSHNIPSLVKLVNKHKD